MSSSNPDPSNPAARPAAEASGRLQCGPLAGTVAALLAGLLTWGILQAIFPVFKLPDELATLPVPAPGDKVAEQMLAQAKADRHNAILTLAILAAAMAGFLVAAEAMARGRVRSVLWRSPLAATIGALFGAGAGLLGIYVLDALQGSPSLSPLGETIAMQCAELGLLGVGIGVGVGTALGSLRLSCHSALGGVLGGVLAAIAYPPSVGYLLPNAQTEHLVPIERGSQLIWLAAISLLVALVMTGLGRNRNRRGKAREG